MLAVGDEVTAKILKFDQEKNRVSLGMKQLGEDPWVGLSRRYPPGTRLFGKVTNITDYGAFVEIESGIEGLVHVSEMDWTNKNIHPTKVVQLGDEVEVMILEIDEERRRISLGMKQCMPNPWDEFAMNHKKGDKVTGQIKSITDFGVFVGLPGGIDGLVHLSDLSWTLPGEAAVRDYKKGAEVEAVVLAIDVERERISLGIKQLDGDPFTNYVATHDKGNVVKGTVKSLDGKGAVIALDGDVEGYLRASEVARDRVEDIRTHLKEGDPVTAMIINIDRKNRRINLSIKAKDHAEETRGDPERQGGHRGREHRDDQSRRAAAGQDGQQDHRVSGPRDDQIGADRPPRGAVPAAGREGRRARGQDDPRRDGREPREGGAHRDPRVRQLRPELPAAAHRTQSEVRREGAGAGEARAALQGGQGIARAGRLQDGERRAEAGTRSLRGAASPVAGRAVASR